MWNQTARNLAYGAIHRPAQVLRWVGGLLNNEAAPVGSGMIEAADQADAFAYEAFQPYVPQPPGLVNPPPGSVVTQPQPSHRSPPQSIFPCAVGQSLETGYIDPQSPPTWLISEYEGKYPGTVWSVWYNWQDFHWWLKRDR